MIVQHPVMSGVFYICSYLLLQCQMVYLSNPERETRANNTAWKKPLIVVLAKTWL